MTIESDYPGFSGYRDIPGQASDPNAGTSFVESQSFMPPANGRDEETPGEREPATAASPENGQAPSETGPADSSGDGLEPAPDGTGEAEVAVRERNGEAPALHLPDDLTGKLKHFTRPASDCINKARRIARELNHTSVSPAHLALALTLDARSSRRLRDQGVDVDLAREAVVRYLAKYNCTYTSGALPPAAEPNASPDLSDIMEAATRFAHEREDEEEINISDLLDAFRKSGSGAKLLYAVSEAPDQVPAVIRRVEQGIGQQLEHLFAEMERRLQAAPQLDQLVADVETRLRGDTEERNAQLEQQVYALRQLGAQLAEQVNVLAQATAKRPGDGGGWWSGGR